MEDADGSGALYPLQCRHQVSLGDQLRSFAVRRQVEQQRDVRPAGELRLGAGGKTEVSRLGSTLQCDTLLPGCARALVLCVPKQYDDCDQQDKQADHQCQHDPGTSLEAAGLRALCLGIQLGALLGALEPRISLLVAPGEDRRSEPVMEDLKASLRCAGSGVDRAHDSLVVEPAKN